MNLVEEAIDFVKRGEFPASTVQAERPLAVDEATDAHGDPGIPPAEVRFTPAQREGIREAIERNCTADPSFAKIWSAARISPEKVIDFPIASADAINAAAALADTLKRLGNTPSQI